MKQIWPVILAVVFLIPATGLIYTETTCVLSNITKIVLDPNYHCSAEDEKVHVQSCCEKEHQADQRLAGTSAEYSLSGDKENCCDNEIRYLRQQDEYTPPGKVHAHQFEITLTIPLLAYHKQNLHSIEPRAQSHSDK